MSMTTPLAKSRGTAVLEGVWGGGECIALLPIAGLQ